MDVYLLKTLPGREPTLNRSQGIFYTDAETRTIAPNKELLERMKNGENYFSVPTKLAWLAGNVAHTLKKPVVTDLGNRPEKADGVYWFCFPYPRDDVEAFRKAFEQNVGLTLVPARREIEVLVVNSAGQPSAYSQD